MVLQYSKQDCFIFLGKLMVRTTQSQAAKVLWLKIDTDNSSVKDYVT